jgi:hypothetical protein
MVVQPDMSLQPAIVLERFPTMIAPHIERWRYNATLEPDTRSPQRNVPVFD